MTNDTFIVPARHGRFVVVGDLQPTSLLELLRESNRVERARIVEAIAREPHDFVVTLGDLVFLGDDAREWRAVDPVLAAWGTVFPVLGNHDYGLFSRRALRNFDARFGHLGGRRWYRVRYGDLAILFLDSNRIRMPESAWLAQLRWYETALAEADRDPSIARVLVIVHHPPYTNSRVTSDDMTVRWSFVPPIHRTAKAVGMLSGHVHAYERFARNGRQFVVSGGGGGPRVSLLEGAERRHGDDLVSGAAPRPFHYLRFDSELRCEVFGFDTGPTELRRIDSFSLQNTAPSTSPP